MGLLDELKKILTPDQLQVAETVLQKEEKEKADAIAADNARREAEANAATADRQALGARKNSKPFPFQVYGKRVYRPDHPDYKKGA